MKDAELKVVATGVLLVGSMLLSVPAWSMDELSDGQLSETTGQDGVTILVKIPASNINIDQVAVFDGDGFAGQASPGALVMGKNANGAGVAAGTLPTLGNGLSVGASGTIALVVDASGGGIAGATTGTAPVLNVGIKLPSALTLVTGDLGIAAASGAVGSFKVNANTTTGSGVVKIMGSSTLTVNLAGNPLINFQLGTPGQGAIFKFSSFNISSIVYGTPISFESPNGGVGASRLTMTPTLTGLDLSGSTLGIYTAANLNTAFGLTAGTLTAGGFLFQPGATPLTITTFSLDTVTAGTVGATSTGVTTGVPLGSTFASTMTNASMGSFGATGISVSGLKIGISGM
jgi:hypothetical protein